MTEADLLHEIENVSSISQARRLVESSPQGFEVVLFDRLRHEVGRDKHRAMRLAKAGEALTGARASWGHRFRAVRHRLDHRWMASANEFLKAEETHGDPAEAAAMAVGAIDSLARSGRTKGAAKLAARLIDTLEQHDRKTDAGRAALNAGNALLWADRVEDAAPLLEKAAALLDGSPIEQAGAWLGVSTSFIDFGTSAQVRAPAERALAAFTALGLDNYASIAEQNIAQADLMSGRHDDALRRLLRLKGAFPVNSEEFARNEQHLGETYLRLNLLAESRIAYRDALKCTAMRRLPFNQAQCHLGLAEVEFALGRAKEGEENADKAAVAFKRLGNQAGVAVANALVAQHGSGKGHEALVKAIEQLERAKIRRKTAELLLLMSERHPLAEGLHRGREIVERHGLLDLHWRVHVANARTQPVENRLDAYRKMAAAMWESRALHRSTIARQHFLHDKDAALREYLGALLQDPTEENVAEALQVVGEARSVALIDEIILARRGSLSPEQGLELEALREQIREALAADARQDGTRRSSAVDLEPWRRAWHEAARPLLAHATGSHEGAADLTYLLAHGEYHQIRGLCATAACGAEEVEHLTRWLGFELLEPIVNPGADTSAVMKTAAVLAAKIGFEPDGSEVSVLPDEALWHLPWPVLAAVKNSGCEPVLSLAPAFQKRFIPAKRPISVLVLYQESESLPHIGREVESISRVFGDVRLCNSACEARKALAGGRVDLMHVATHAALSPRNPMFSYLEFNDGRIFAAEIARSGVRPKLVTMSACEAGAVSTLQSNEPDGLVRASLALGAESVVASAWPLDDRASSVFTLPYYQALSNGAGVVDAVREGRSAVRQALAHPYYWGAMVTFGGYRDR